MTSTGNGTGAKPKRRRGSRGGRRHKKATDAKAEPQAAEPTTPVEEQQPEPQAKPTRRRGGRRHKKPTDAKAEPQATEPTTPVEEQQPEPQAKPTRRRGSRGGRRHKKTTTAEAEPQAAESIAPAEEPQTKPKRKRGGQRGKKATADAGPSPVTARPPLTTTRARTPVTGAPTEDVPAPFAHPAEYEFARILDFYGITWQYEPRSFPLRWEQGHVAEAFTPDFYLPDLDMFVEITTLKTGLTAEKNRKMRLLKQLHPEVNIKLLKKRDYLRLLAKYGYGPLAPEQVPEIDRVLIPVTKLQRRVGELGALISHDYAGKEPVLIGILRGVICFMSDLMRSISIPAAAVDFMSVSSYEGNGSGAVRILKDLDENIKGRDVILVEDIVDTGMTLNHIMEYLQSKRPASLRVCTLLDKQVRRIANVPLDYIGFEIPDEFVVGYGLDFRQRFRNLPFIAVLKHDLLP